MRRWLFQGAGLISLGFGIAGIFLPLLPTVPFLLLTAWCFAKGNPEWEQRLLLHPRYGPPILAWRERGAIGRKAKGAALVALAFSAAMGLAFLPPWWNFLPLVVALVCGTWILSRPSS